MRDKDWTGNRRSTYVTLGASNHSQAERQEHDFYATDPAAAEHLIKRENFNTKIWECACGKKHLSYVFEKHGFEVRSSDIVDRCGNEVLDFLSEKNTHWDGDIVTNPPYRFALDFIKKALQIIPQGNKVAMFLKLQFLEGKERKKFFASTPPKIVYVFSSRIMCAKNAEFEKIHSSAVAYAWYVWEKGYTGHTTIKWI